jgi:hypothetical protein
MRSILFAEYEPMKNITSLSERGFEMTNMNDRVSRSRPLPGVIEVEGGGEADFASKNKEKKKKGDQGNEMKRALASKSRRKRTMVAVAIGIVCLVLAISLGVVFGTKEGGPSPTLNGPTSLINYTAWSQDQLFGGANAYFIQNLPESDQDEAISLLATANIKVIRTIISGTPAKHLNSTSLEVYDVEYPVAGVYNDTILSRLDRVMWKAYTSKMKLIIAFHNRDNLGCGE